MKSITKYLVETQESLWHFTNSRNLEDICNTDCFICSDNDGRNPKEYSYYISTSRQRNSITGYPTQLISPDIARIELDERKLHSKYKIVSVAFTQAKNKALKSNWYSQDFDKYKDYIMLQSEVENEDRILTNIKEIRQFHKYIKSVHLNTDTIQPGATDTIIRYCDKWNIPCEVLDNKTFKYGK